MSVNCNNVKYFTALIAISNQLEVIKPPPARDVIKDSPIGYYWTNVVQMTEKKKKKSQENSAWSITCRLDGLILSGWFLARISCNVHQTREMVENNHAKLNVDFL